MNNFGTKITKFLGKYYLKRLNKEELKLWKDT